MKQIIGLVLVLVIVCGVVSCRTRQGVRKDDPYLYKRGVWNFNKGGLVDDIPQFTLQMLESMLDYGAQPVDPPSEYAPTQTGPADYAVEWVPEYSDAIAVPDAKSGIGETEEKVLGY